MRRVPCSSYGQESCGCHSAELATAVGSCPSTNLRMPIPTLLNGVANDLPHLVHIQRCAAHLFPETFSYAVHSANPPGAANITGLLDRFLQSIPSEAVLGDCESKCLRSRLARVLAIATVTR